MEKATTPEIELLVSHIKAKRWAISREIDEMPGEWGERDGNGDAEFINDDTEAYRLASAKDEVLRELLKEIAKIYGWDFTIPVAKYETVSPETGIVFDTEILKNKLGDYQISMKLKSDFIFDQNKVGGWNCPMV